MCPPKSRVNPSKQMMPTLARVASRWRALASPRAVTTVTRP
ncbi:MAG: hypothetical protein ACLRSD_00460 [Oscillibacter sp.]